MGLGVKIITFGLGFASEAIHAVSAPRSSPTLPPEFSVDQDRELTENATSYLDTHSANTEDVNSQPTSAQKHQHTSSIRDLDSTETLTHDDEALWELDEMAEGMRSPPCEEPMEIPENETEEEKIAKREALVRDLVAMAGPPPQEVHRLPCSVIIPQRRPRSRQRGFVGAYAPVLADCGISADVFLRFVDYLDQVNRASAWIEVTFVAAQIMGSFPEPAVMIVGTVLAVIAGTARELQMRKRKNTFLDRVNQEIFMPRGLYAMIMAFTDHVPGEQQGVLSKLSGSVGKTIFSKQQFGTDETIEKFTTPESNKFKRGLNKIRLVSGKTHGDLELPEAAELVYPRLDHVAVQAVAEGEQGKEGSKLAGLREKTQGASKWVQDYMDRRAHVFYEANHPGTSLAIPPEQRAPMKSRFNDPSHPVHSGSFISLITGGLVPLPGVDKIGMAASERIGIRRLMGTKTPEGKLPESYGMRIAKKVMQEGVLYLLVVNLPSEEEVQESVTKLEGMVQRDPATSANADTDADSAIPVFNTDPARSPSPVSAPYPSGNTAPAPYTAPPPRYYASFASSEN
ncbi:hypothetical protein BO71DRAFT_386616 [Aspergillus ellipticus CBS 707.79]|uniref:Uncharacterized protein n=1 Tax=Aspergillus ellipticus CBS 707.79 TaxID=1448320 RepID=A0A319EIZ9_9EURO|nr:hypothetical protein BO71DRAFT_386616 [Aspergillus ellipticus CBS 707.79]